MTDSGPQLTTGIEYIIMRPSSVGGGRILRRTLSVRLSVRPSRACILTKIGHVFSSNLADVRYLLFCLHLRAAYCRAISRTSLLLLCSAALC